MEYRPMTRWWWASPYNLSEFSAEIDAIAAAGFGGVEAAFSTEGWATDDQRAALKTSLEAAERNGIQFDMTMGASWPVTTPATNSTSGLSEKEIYYGRADVIGPIPYVGPVPVPNDDIQGSKVKELVAVVAGKVLEPGVPVAATTPITLTPTGPYTAPLVSTVLDPESVIDLTDQVDSSGNIVWSAPAGEYWILFGIWQRVASEGVMDHISAESARAVGAYLDANQIGEDSYSLLRSVGGSFFEDSLELDVNEVMWTPGFLQQFEQRRGYNLTKYLPVLFVQGFQHYYVPENRPNPDFDFPDGLGDRIRHDYLQTVTDLYVECHMQEFQNWAETHEMNFRTQPAYGNAFDVVRSAREVVKAGGIADDESLNAGDPAELNDTNWRYAMDHYRAVLGGVHQAGGKEVCSELGAMFWRAHEATLELYKEIMDKEWALGITRPIIHGFTYQVPDAAWPGTDHFLGIVADSWNQYNFPQWSMFRPLTDYWARGNLVLQQGSPKIDVAVYRDNFSTSAATFWALATDIANHQVDPLLPIPILTTPDGGELIDDAIGAKPSRMFDGESLERAGYTFEYIDPLGFLEPNAPGDGTLFPDGPSYKAIIIDERALPAATAEAIADEAEKGLAVVFVGLLPDHGTSYADAAAEDARVIAAVQRMLKCQNVRRVDLQTYACEALQTTGIEPGLMWAGEQPIYSQHRACENADYWYLWNSENYEVDFEGEFQVDGTPFELDLWTGDIEKIYNYRTENGRTIVPIVIQPGETKVLAFKHGESKGNHITYTDAEEVVEAESGAEIRDTQSGARTVKFSDGTATTIEIPALPSAISPSTWQLHVDEVGPSGITPHDLELTALSDWRDISEISKASGTGTYTTRISLGDDWIAENKGAYLELGEVHGAIQVYMNGERVSPSITSERRFDVAGFIHSGDNELKVVLTTTLKNEIVGLTQSGNVPSGLTMVAQQATMAYGLIGPVQIIPYGSAEIGADKLASLNISGLGFTGVLAGILLAGLILSAIGGIKRRSA